MSAIPDLWHPETVYLNTASFGLPPDPVWDALPKAQEDWRAGRVSWEHWTAVTDRARAQFATLVGADADRVAVGATVSGLIAQVAAAIPDGSRVLAPEPEFVSLLFPFLAQAGRGVTVDVVRSTGSPRRSTRPPTSSRSRRCSPPPARSPTSTRSPTAAAHHGALTVIDATHAIGWLPLDATRFDAVACAVYKWLMSPRGTAFMVLERRTGREDDAAPGRLVRGQRPADRPVRPAAAAADTARRFDTSPAWFCWVGTEPALALHQRDRRRGDPRARPRARQPLPRGPRAAAADSAIVTSDVPDATEKLARAGIMAAARAGRLRASFHLYNTEADVDAALDVLSPASNPVTSTATPRGSSPCRARRRRRP